MLTDCENPKCEIGSGIEAKLDVKSNEVVCLTCRAKIPVTEFMKNMMKSQNDVVTADEIKLPPNGFKATCDNEKCNQDFSAEYNQERGEVICPHCDSVAKINNISKGMLESNGIFTGYTLEYFQEEGQTAKSPMEIAKEVARRKIQNRDDVQLGGGNSVGAHGDAVVVKAGNIDESVGVEPVTQMRALFDPNLAEQLPYDQRGESTEVSPDETGEHMEVTQEASKEAVKPKSPSFKRVAE